MVNPDELAWEDRQKWMESVQQDCAQVVRTRLEKEGVTPYALAKRLRGIVSQRAVYDFLEGKDTRLKTMLAIFHVCELTLGIGRRAPDLIAQRNYTKRELILRLRVAQQRSWIGEFLIEERKSTLTCGLKWKWQGWRSPH
jgi:hypothetical protein